MSFTPALGAGALTLQAATPVAGFALVNGTPAILNWTAPADGQQHRFVVFATMNVTVTQVGGAVEVSYCTPDQATTTDNVFPGLFAGGQGVGPNYDQVYSLSGIVKPGSTVSVAQGSALTSGAALMWAEIWGS
jgi:hypothetical protein